MAKRSLAVTASALALAVVGLAGEANAQRGQGNAARGEFATVHDEEGHVLFSCDSNGTVVNAYPNDRFAEMTYMTTADGRFSSGTNADDLGLRRYEFDNYASVETAGQICNHVKHGEGMGGRGLKDMPQNFWQQRQERIYGKGNGKFRFDDRQRRGGNGRDDNRQYHDDRDRRYDDGQPQQPLPQFQLPPMQRLDVPFDYGQPDEPKRDGHKGVANPPAGPGNRK